VSNNTFVRQNKNSEQSQSYVEASSIQVGSAVAEAEEKQTRKNAIIVSGVYFNPFAI